jgi:hypothetical protein
MYFNCNIIYYIMYFKYIFLYKFMFLNTMKDQINIKNQNEKYLEMKEVYNDKIR